MEKLLAVLFFLFSVMVLFPGCSENKIESSADNKAVDTGGLTIDVKTSSKKNWLSGMGGEILSAGRFGKAKGDGVLAYSFPNFGIMEKVYLKKHPLNKNNVDWAMAFFPQDVAEKPRFNHAKPNSNKWGQGAEDIKDKISVNWVAVKWDKTFTNQSKKRLLKSENLFYNVSYNILTPGLLIETNETDFSLDLTRTAGFQSLGLNFKTGFKSVDIKGEKLLYSHEKDGDLSENWLCLYNSKAFPDVPIMLIMKSNPDSISAVYNKGKLQRLNLQFKKGAGFIIPVTPYGMQAFKAGSLKAQEKKFREKCRFWSKVLLAYITDCHEKYSIDKEQETVTIKQEFKYKELKDDWGTKSVKIAPYPPTLNLVRTYCPDVQLLNKALDLEFPTKYGPLAAVVGSTESSYILPVPPVGNRFPIPHKGQKLSKKIQKAFPMQRHDGSKALPSELFPGLWSRTDRNSVDLGTMASQWIWLQFYFTPEQRQNLKGNCRDLLIDIFDDQEEFAKTELYKSIQKTKIDKDKLCRPLWFNRSEPFTGKKYIVSYTIPPVRSGWYRKRSPKMANMTPDKYKKGMTDLEWGAAFALMGIHHMGRLSGDWQLVEKHWQKVKDIYALLEVLQDWACMSTSGSESGRRWTDTSSYPGFIAYREIARMLGKTKAEQQGIYIHAKQVAMRLAMFMNGTFVNKYYGSKPWMVQHSFTELPRNFQEVYEPMRAGTMTATKENRRSDGTTVISRGSYYSLVAEGTGVECPEFIFKYIPKEAKFFMKKYDELYPKWNTEAYLKAMNKTHHFSGGITFYQKILCELYNSDYSTEVIKKHFTNISKAKLQRILPGAYRRWLAFHEHLEALVETRDDPAFIFDWEKCKINSALYKKTDKEVLLEIDAQGEASVTLICSKPAKVSFKDSALAEGKDWSFKKKKLKISLPGKGSVKIKF